MDSIRTRAGTPAAEAPAAAAATVEGDAPRFGVRWTICALLFAATTINYMDRQVLGLLAPTLQRELGWSESAYGDIVSWFSFAYAIGFLGMGRVMDRLGVRRGFSLAIVAWSLAAMGHAAARTAAGFSIARAALGLGESGNFPGSIKAVTEWFPRRERAFATGIFNGGSNVGALVAPVLVPAVTLAWGWRWAFVVTGALGFVWLGAWLLVYRSPREHPRVGGRELALIQSDPAESTEPVAWLGLLRHRQTWAFFLAKGLTDPIWWFYLYWLPKFLDSRWHINLAAVTLPLIVIYLVADVGSVAGGWLSSRLIARGWSVNAGRKTALLLAAVAIVPTMLAPRAGSVWTAVAIVSVAAAAHQWWSCNLFTTASDMFPRRAVGSVVGIGGFAGAMGGVLFQRATGRILDATNHDYQIVFTICGLAYVTALVLMHLIVPRLQPADLDTPRTA